MFKHSPLQSYKLYNWLSFVCQMLYCRVCAEPFHLFCLEEDPVDTEWWTCNRCRTCCVCGHQNKVSHQNNSFFKIPIAWNDNGAQARTEHLSLESIVLLLLPPANQIACNFYRHRCPKEEADNKCSSKYILGVFRLSLNKCKCGW